MLWRKRNDPQMVDIEMTPERNRGLTRAAIEAYPITIYGEKKEEEKPTVECNTVGLIPQDSIDSPSTSSLAKTDVEEPDVCTICIDDYVKGEKVRTLDCGHFFHVSCIDEWLAKISDCPLCKAVMGGKEDEDEGGETTVDEASDDDEVPLAQVAIQINGMGGNETDAGVGEEAEVVVQAETSMTEVVDAVDSQVAVQVDTE
jgi:hypothetical protein